MEHRKNKKNKQTKQKKKNYNRKSKNANKDDKIIGLKRTITLIILQCKKIDPSMTT